MASSAGVRVLLVGYFFPPHGGPGPLRLLAFARDLPAHGITPVVLASPPSPDYWAADPSLLGELPADVEVHRVSEGPAGLALSGLRRLARGRVRVALDRLWVPDRRIGWLRPAVRAGLDAARTAKVDAIVASGPPWTALLVGRALAQRLGVPLVVDLRDPWSTSGDLSERVRPLHRRLEARVFSRAARIYANTDAARDVLVAAHPGAASRVAVLPNGFDEAHFAGLPSPAPPPPVRLAYAGSFYPGRGPQEFLALMRKCLLDEPSLRVRLDLYGNTNQAEAIRAAGLGAVVTEHGFVPHAAALAGLARAHAALVVEFEREGNAPSIPQKTYELLRLGRPVLFVGRPGSPALALLRSAGLEATALDGPGAAPALAAFLRRRAAAATSPRPDPAIVARFERGALSARLAGDLWSLTGAARRDR